MRALRLPALAISFAVLGGLTGPAHADAIDGAWCSQEGRRFEIAGSSVTTTRGITLTGNYSRHRFAFTLPPEEADGGAPVDMNLQGEMRVLVKIGTGESQVWRRCPPGVS